VKERMTLWITLVLIQLYSNIGKTKHKTFHQK
jgi:hypothetical protein